MMKKVINKEDLNSVEFLKMPAMVIYDDRYKGIRAEGKLLYGILLNLLNLSIKKNWLNKDGEPFVKLSRDKMKELLNIKGSAKISEVVRELRAHGLIEERGARINGCNEIYLYVEDYFNNDFKFTKGESFTHSESLVEDEVCCTNICANEENPLDNESEAPYNFETMTIDQETASLKIKVPKMGKSKVPTFENQNYIKNNFIKNNLIKNNDENQRDDVKDITLLDSEALKIEPKENIHNTTSIAYPNESLEMDILDENNLYEFLENKLKDILGYKPEEAPEHKKDETNKNSIYEIDDSDLIEDFIASKEKATDTHTKANFKEIFKKQATNVEKGKIFGFEKTEAETIQEIYKDYALTKNDIQSLLKASNNNLYLIDLAYEQTIPNISKIRNFVAYNIAVIKKIKI